MPNKTTSFLKVSDDHLDNYLQTRECSSSDQDAFEPCHLVSLMQLCTQLTSVVIVVKSPSKHRRHSSTNCAPLFNTSMYTKGGYIGRFCKLAARSPARLKSISLNVDLVVPYFSQLHMPCPMEDLMFAVSKLINKPFQVFIQISFCSSNYAEGDSNVSCMLLNAMYRLRQQMQYTYDCTANIDLGAEEGYVDLIVEKENIEYSFAFFYYNPAICEVHPSLGKYPTPLTSLPATQSSFFGRGCHGCTSKLTKSGHLLMI